jgi:uncharacterized membrane protein YgaE (UPF0421/DUF939 family)
VLLYIIGGLVALYFAILLFLLPLFVRQINDRVKKIKEEMEAIVVNAHITTQNSTAQVKLLRQLIKAYGHDPEA